MTCNDFDYAAFAGWYLFFILLAGVVSVAASRLRQSAAAPKE